MISRRKAARPATAPSLRTISARGTVPGRQGVDRAPVSVSPVVYSVRGSVADELLTLSGNLASIP